VLENDAHNHWIVADPGRNIAVTSNKDADHLTIFNLSDGSMRPVAVPRGAEGLAYSADGRSLNVMDHVNPAMMVVDPDTWTVTRTVALHEYPQLQMMVDHMMRVTVSPDGKWTAVNGFNYGLITLMPAGDLDAQTTIPAGPGLQAMLFDDKRAELYASNGRTNTVSVFDVPSLTLKRTLVSGLKPISGPEGLALIDL